MDLEEQKKAIETGLKSQSAYFHSIGRSRGLCDFEIDDLCQDTAMRCLQSIGKVNWATSPTDRDALVRKFARWALSTFCQKRAKRNAKVEPNYDLDRLPIHDSQDMFAALVKDEEYAILLAKIQFLDRRKRQVLYERYFEGQSDRDIAIRREEPLETIRTRHKRGIQELRTLVSIL